MWYGFVGFTKAFDTVNHAILLDKLDALGFSCSALSWLASYLGGRTQMVEVGGILSDSLSVQNGVPQGSILGPLLFLLYINDIQAVCEGELFLYADDAALLIADKGSNSIQAKLGDECIKVKEWLADNKLLLHLGKSESILFGSNYNLRREEELIIKIDNHVLANKSSVKYLGCVLDRNLNGQSMAWSVWAKSMPE